MLVDGLGRNVDLVMTSALRNRWFAREAAKARTVIDDIALARRGAIADP